MTRFYNTGYLPFLRKVWEIVIALWTNEPDQYTNLISQRRGGASQYPHFDALGSTRALTDSSESITDTFLYDAWGNLLSRSGTTEIPFRFVGRFGYHTDADTESTYIVRRIYQPTLARWWSVDPLVFVDSINAYIYADNTPVQTLDPEGLATVSDSFKDLKLPVKWKFVQERGKFGWTSLFGDGRTWGQSFWIWDSSGNWKTSGDFGKLYKGFRKSPKIPKGAYSSITICGPSACNTAAKSVDAGTLHLYVRSDFRVAGNKQFVAFIQINTECTSSSNGGSATIIAHESKPAVSILHDFKRQKDAKGTVFIKCPPKRRETSLHFVTLKISQSRKAWEKLISWKPKIGLTGKGCTTIRGEIIPAASLSDPTLDY